MLQIIQSDASSFVVGIIAYFLIIAKAVEIIKKYTGFPLMDMQPVKRSLHYMKIRTSESMSE